MMTKRENQQIEMHLITIEDLVPTDHLLRKVNDIIDFSFIYDEVESMYCSNNGRPSIDPVVLIKFLLPDHSTISQNRCRRFNGSGLFRSIFQKIVTICIEKGLADGKLVFTDSTHIKANASRKTEYIKQTEEVTNEYLEELDQYEEAVRNQLEAEGKIKPVRCRKWKEKAETINRRESKTDPESGFYKRKGKAEGMHYLSHETVDSKNGIIIDVAATAGNVPDSKPYIERIDYIEKNLGLKIQEACADSGYDTNLINQQLSERDIDFYTPERTEQKRGTTEFQRKFATQKARHNLKFLYRRGLEAAEQQCLLSSTALNLKRMIKAMA